MYNDRAFNIFQKERDRERNIKSRYTNYNLLATGLFLLKKALNQQNDQNKYDHKKSA